jgi:hypothetical protein
MHLLWQALQEERHRVTHEALQAETTQLCL